MKCVTTLLFFHYSKVLLLKTLAQYLAGALVANLTNTLNDGQSSTGNGFNNGLKLGEVTFSTSENSGNILIPLTSKEPDLETQPPLRLLLTDYPTTKAFYDSL
jgi:hypothetical protein